ncbi:MAG TPA: outer membrane protein assembly factor BamA [Candidatus Marinimicrobia bacterium]|nr:outer membrane protein assembly factor BamA [Candidatus Neomarinimicrobiota bacterium]MDP6275720.1 outer membrane protein assembly factor BamA [Candidatus Neomarinimicrobiota bacterium]MDP7331091.1 outer membrane protein assembly factor BamA [Candidatus Neomarinimicrobiota bacterium]HJM70546.1 outer membrane protein assembly factor BamA [Candidatus Neomarinimicrobiota bacterium]
MLRKHMKYFLFLLLAVYSLYAQQEELQLHKLNIEGNNLTSESMIRYTAGLREGENIAPGDFSRAVKRLWQLGLFNDIQIRMDKESEDGLTLTIVVSENYILGEIRFEGNKKIKDKKFDEELSLRSGMRIRPNLTNETITKMKKLYADDGYLLVDIEAVVEEPKGFSATKDAKKKQTRDLIFNIRENKKVKLRKIIFEGNEQFSSFRLRRELKETKMQRWYLFWRSHFDKNKYEEDKLNLLNFYHNEGYRDATIVSDSVYFDEKKKAMSIFIKISEGPQYHYRNFSWEGNSLFTEEELNRAMDLAIGEKYNEEEFNLAVFERMHGLYMDRGYIYSNVTPRFTPVGKDSLDIHFEIVENHKVYIRNIYVQGNEKTRENVIRRELHVFPGDVFNRTLLQRSARELFILNYFSNVVPDVLPVDEDEVDLEITVEEKSSDRANANVGYSGVYGLMGGGGVEFNNFRGLGQQLMASYQVGSQRSMNYYSTNEGSQYESFSVRFMDPMIFDTPNRVGFSFYNSFRGRSMGYGIPLDIQILGGSVQWGRRFKWPDDYFRGYWVLNSSTKTYDGSQSEIDTYAGGLEKTRGLGITQVISRDSRDRQEFTSMGSRFTWETTVSGGPLGGNEDFVKHVLNLEWYTPTFWKFVLMSSLKMGVVDALPSKEERSIIPFDEKFIMGGNGIPFGNMLRGYAENSIGPKSSSGNTVPGNALMRFVSELRVPFSENPVIYGLMFAEAGNVWNTASMTEPFSIPRSGPLSLKRSAGFGIRFFMPMIGMLGFDMGYGFDDNDGNGKADGWNYTIIFGQSF